YVETTQDRILITPATSKFKTAEVDSHNDHRIAMSIALLGLKYQGVIVNNAEAVSKNCQDYFDRMRALLG
ncbi:3-phosphoshikimate 1-carboxyvinyltransferase, partial [Francisella tularensis subsp. holarctica]|nr:3-phosphoshikimate 1-carboxyvinyltransferase [Francisella tularensis subsp. holarctica]